MLGAEGGGGGGGLIRGTLRYMLSYKPGRTVVAYAIPVHTPPPGNKVYFVNVMTYYSMHMYAMRQNSVLKGMGAHFKIYRTEDICYLFLYPI